MILFVRTSDFIDEHRICCSELVSVDSTTLVLYLLIIFILFSLCFLLFSKIKNLLELV
jgi:hypothetical protein